MTIGINKKERVNRKVKKSLERKDHINVIYKADEATRRAIDTLYVRKAEHRKMVLFVAGLATFVGLAIGVWFGMTQVHTASANANSAQNVVQAEVVGQSKDNPQPKN